MVFSLCFMGFIVSVSWSLYGYLLGDLFIQVGAGNASSTTRMPLLHSIAPLPLRAARLPEACNASSATCTRLVHSLTPRAPRALPAGAQPRV